ncbi:YqaJ viral recombinase family protein [Leucobacter sp. CSA1]|uniref:YqaJ viral recombinase family protein n=1 Tax=Leucobacter chromiisoli TaxID=2796471 RepID=A0A934QBS0_9MICO|nr:YqaJ viral recombinase family protein [Leucobacter chromiisoli]MBK0420387.1 YqaJ viral recombinase family protein [Leucobacter chromiisoli]
MVTYEVVDVVPDTPEWEQERRNSVGASEVAAVMGLSPYATALDVYRSKQGVDREFDPLLSFIGHESEHIIHKWVEEFSGVDVKLEPAFMARSAAYPFLHASFDRVSSIPFTTWQFKTAHHYTGHKWDEGIPTDIRIQVQAEMLVAGTQRAAVVVWIGGREFRLFWEDRDDRFIDDHMLPALTTFWENLQADVAPPPANVAEMAEAWHDSGDEMEAPEELQDRIEQRAFLLASAKEMEADANKIRDELGAFMLEHNVEKFTVGGKTLLTYKRQNGRASFDGKRFREEHPDLAAEYTQQGAPYLVMRTYKPKETK